MQKSTKKQKCTSERGAFLNRRDTFLTRKFSIGVIQFSIGVIRNTKCNNIECGLIVYRDIADKHLSDKQLSQLFTEGKTKLIKGFIGKNSKPFDANVMFDADFKVTFSFPPPQKKKGVKIRPR